MTPRILIVDDDPSVRRMLQLTFEHAGLSVSVAEHGADALRKFQAQPFELVVMDVVMPEKEGIETIVELRALYPATRVIAISGGARFGLKGDLYLEPEKALQVAQRVGADRGFPKPVDNERLIAAARELLGLQTTS